MRTSRPALLLFLCSLIPTSLCSQSSTQTGTQAQASALLQQSLAAQTGGALVTDVTMAGTVTVTAGTNTQSGTITLVATAAGQSRVTFALPSGTWITTQNYAANPRTSTTSAPSDVTNNPAPEDLLGPHPAWFYPALIIGAGLQANNYVTSQFGQEMHEGSTTQHVGIWPQSPVPIYSYQISGRIPLTMPTPEVPLYFGQQDLYLDPSSLYPLALVFRFRGSAAAGTTSAPASHPMYLPEEVRFANYQMVQGRPVALRVQVYVGNMLVDDIQVSSVNFNTGAVIAAN